MSVEKGWYRSSTGRKVEVVAVDSVRPAADADYFDVAAYRYEGRIYVHIRAVDDIVGWERLPEEEQ